MRNLFLFFSRYHAFFLFLFLEVICVVLIIQNNHFQRTQFMSSAGEMSSGVFGVRSMVTDYFGLQEKNAYLAEQNAKLLTQLNKMDGRVVVLDSLQSKTDTTRIDSTQIDSTQIAPLYQFKESKVINKSVHRLHNYLTINKGSNHGLRPEMGVIGTDGVVGIVDRVSPNYSTVLSLLHKQSYLSAKIKKNNYFGSLIWNGKSEFVAQLKDVPNNIPVEKSDTIVTSGYSSLFVAGIPVGTVENLHLEPGSNFQLIDVRLSTIFRKVDYVYVIDFKDQAEIKALEAQIPNE